MNWALLIITLVAGDTVEVRRVGTFGDLISYQRVMVQFPNAHCIRIPRKS